MVRLLNHVGHLAFVTARRLIITGMTGNICVLFTASDAYMRDFPAVCSL